MATFPAKLHPKFDPFTYLNPEGETLHGKIKGWEDRVKLMGSEDYLHALETMGRIPLFTPILASLMLFIGGVQMGSLSREKGHLLPTG
ncbi:hypothetical protein EO98_05185 [Methanosarcina sp. 2.H.T.1A.6]|uniref:hypothetical protein n=1 Tax=unclassified Methanosarcina TaxID=2644672 RepID=UPI0006223A9A|nr:MULTISPECIES: hypothetical protein [unclassified Methanosarcina]KKG15451.1 hypothetical protein EO94_00340 [Methanosarcina sp. 2.H.T.1A.3]KKG24800.1 hypothetical protein EO98_05185 [Methanosarcina sp. 2.H.T.1A.6]KKG26082.1 hypothetical protein EO96_16410 [Methanosarcina sp. 2.H.T.1A.8]